ncbi:Panacea domain-containing protein [Desulfovibrio caledoniensis]
MANCLDVAQYILERRGPTSTIKLQKLVFYSLAWSLVWDEDPIFTDKIEAWANGPVAPRLFHEHKGLFKADSIPHGHSENLTKDQKETVDKVIEFYGNKSAHWLVELTHMERPWKEARGDCPPGESCNNPIPIDKIAEFYSAL